MSRLLALLTVAVSLLAVGVVRPLEVVFAESGVENSEGEAGESGGEGSGGEGSEGEGSGGEGSEGAGEGSEGEGTEGGSEGSEGGEGSEGSEGEGAEGGSEGSEGGSEGGEEGEEGEGGEGGHSQPIIDAGLLSQVQDYYVTAHQIAAIQVQNGSNAELKAISQAIMTGWTSKISALGAIFADLGLDTVEPGEVVTFQEAIHDLANTPAGAEVDGKAHALLESALNQGIAFAESKVGQIQDTDARNAAQQMIVEWKGYRDQLSQ
jgi:hypothetical protein